MFYLTLAAILFPRALMPIFLFWFSDITIQWNICTTQGLNLWYLWSIVLIPSVSISECYCHDLRLMYAHTYNDLLAVLSCLAWPKYIAPLGVRHGICCKCALPGALSASVWFICIATHKVDIGNVPLGIFFFFGGGGDQRGTTYQIKRSTISM